MHLTFSQIFDLIVAFSASIIGAVILLLGGFALYTCTEQKKKRIEVFTELAGTPDWITNKQISKLLSSVPFIFHRKNDYRVKVAYMNYKDGLNRFRTKATFTADRNGAVTVNGDLILFSNQLQLKRDLLRELAISSGWMNRKNASEIDFNSMMISLTSQTDLVGQTLK